MKSYRKNLAWSEEDASWIATSPDFPGLSAAARTDAEALTELGHVLEDAVAIYETEGWSVPGATLARSPEYSGQLRLRLPRSLHAQAAAVAESEEVSLNSLLVAFVAKGLGEVAVLDIVEKRLQGVGAVEAAVDVAAVNLVSQTPMFRLYDVASVLKETTATMQPELPKGASVKLPWT